VLEADQDVRSKKIKFQKKQRRSRLLGEELMAFDQGSQAQDSLCSHSSGLLIHRSGSSHVCSGLEVEMKFGMVKIGVRVCGIILRLSSRPTVQWSGERGCGKSLIQEAESCNIAKRVVIMFFSARAPLLSGSIDTSNTLQPPQVHPAVSHLLLCLG
jgi:hypothetical protein